MTEDERSSAVEAPAWTLESSREVYSNRVFSVAARAMKDRRGKRAEFYAIEGASWVNVVALTRDDQLVLVEQWRHAVAKTTIEIPGGCIDGDEAPSAAARRELLEETGYGSDTWFQLGVVEPNPAIHANRLTTFLALDAELRGPQALDDNEDCRVVLMPFAEVVRRSADGTIAHALVIAALHYERLRREGLLIPQRA